MVTALFRRAGAAISFDSGFFPWGSTSDIAAFTMILYALLVAARNRSILPLR